MELNTIGDALAVRWQVICFLQQRRQADEVNSDGVGKLARLGELFAKDLEFPGPSYKVWEIVGQNGNQLLSEAAKTQTKELQQWLVKHQSQELVAA